MDDDQRERKSRLLRSPLTQLIIKQAKETIKKQKKQRTKGMLGPKQVLVSSGIEVKRRMFFGCLKEQYQIPKKLKVITKKKQLFFFCLFWFEEYTS